MVSKKAADGEGEAPIDAAIWCEGKRGELEADDVDENVNRKQVKRSVFVQGVRVVLKVKC